MMEKKYEAFRRHYRIIYLRSQDGKWFPKQDANSNSNKKKTLVNLCMTSCLLIKDNKGGVQKNSNRIQDI